jgi:catechol 2,3-dioxygenase-like lactoylglutathione lyase family enzyme
VPDFADLFAGVPVGDFERARAWYEQLLGSEPSFLPHDTEAVWEVAEHRFVYIVERPEDAGHAICMVFVDDLDALIQGLADHGLVPVADESPADGVRKVTFRDPDGNEIAFGGSGS